MRNQVYDYRVSIFIISVNIERFYTLVLRIIIGRTITNIFFYSDRDNEIKTIIIRDGTIDQDQIEIRRVFKHPNFKFPSLYDDIAVAELGSLTIML